MRSPSRITFLAAAVLVVLAGCGGSHSGTPDGSNTEQSLRVTPDTLTVAAGTTSTLHVDLITDGEASAPGKLTWTSSDPTVATVSGSNLADPTVKGLKAGQATLTVSSGELTATATITVTDATLTAIAISPSPATGPAGIVTQLTASGTFSDGHTADVTEQATWTSNAANTARVEDTTGNKGKVTGVVIGTAKISATAQGITGSVNFTVSAPTLLSISVQPSPNTLPLGVNQQLTAMGSFSDGSTQAISTGLTWTSSNLAVADVTSGGLLKSKSVGTATINAEKSGNVGSASVEVTAAALKLLAVSPSNVSLSKGSTRQLSALATFTDGTATNATGQATWTSSDTAIASVTSSGLVTAHSEGSATITAAFAGKSTTASVTVTAPSLVSLEISPANSTVAKGLTTQLTATGTYSDGSTSPISSQVTWTSSNTTAVTVSTSGLATAKAVGGSVITASLGTASASTTLTVTAAQIASLTVTPATPTIAKGLTQQFVATAVMTDGTNSTVTTQVTWSTLDASIATVSDTAGSKGLASTKAEGSTTIKATSGTISGQATITVGPAQLTAISIAPQNPSVAKGRTRAFFANGTYTDGNVVDVTAQATWASSNASVAVFNTAAGVASTLAQGTSTITATLGTRSAGTTLTVTPAELVSIALTPSSITVPRGLTTSFAAEGTYTDGTTATLTSSVTWTSSDVNVAMVAGNVATAKNEGSASITATLNGVSASAVLTVAPPALTSIKISPVRASIAPGTTQQFTATGRYSDGTTADITSQAAWTSSNASIASFDTTAGLATANAEGDVTVTATVGSVSAGTTLNVSNTPITLTSISVAPQDVTLAKGLSQQLTATGHFSDGSTADLTAEVSWSSSQQSVAALSTAPGTEGRVSAVSPGQSTITATVNALTATTTVTVTAPALTALAISPLNLTLGKNATQQFTATGTYTDGSTANVTAQTTWSSSDPLVASFSTTTTGLLTANELGSATLTAAIGTTSATTTVTVAGKSVVSIAVTPLNPALPKNFLLPLKALATMSDSTTQDVTASATWTSGNTAVATVNASGVVTTVSNGTAQLTATMGTITGSTTATVSTATCHPYLNEVQTGTAANANDEWVEIANPCTTSFDLNGHNLVYRSAAGTTDTSLISFTTSKVIPAGGFVVFANAQSTMASDGTFTSSMGAAGGGLALKNGTTTVVDAMGWGTATNIYVEGGTPAAAAPSTTQSLIRSPFDGKDSDVSRNDWATSATPTPKAANR